MKLVLKVNLNYKQDKLIKKILILLKKLFFNYEYEKTNL